MPQQLDDMATPPVTTPLVRRWPWSVTLVRISGIELRVDQSWLLVALLVAWSFWARFTSGAQHHSVGAAFVMGVVAAVLFFSSVLAHELAHALEAQHRGVRVGGITLHIFGGTTTVASEARRPRDEFALTAVGPFTSVVVAAALGLVSYASERFGLGEVAEVAGVLGWINLLLAVFNLLPGAPLDGGRILASAVWWITGDRHRAGVVAARAGRALGGLLLAAGLLEIFFVLGGFIGGLWLVFLGWFLYQAAVGEERRIELERLLAGLDVDDLVVDETEAVTPDTSLGWIVANLFGRHHLEAVPVDHDGTTVGIVHVDDVSRVPPEQRFEATAAEVMRPMAGVPRVAVDDRAPALLAAVGQAGLVAITKDGAVVALITARQLDGTLERLRLLEGAGTAQEVRP
jgi:Zn-dependent protease